MMTENTGLAARLDVSTCDRRESDRVPGPFDAWRLGTLDTPARIYDISLGGCFVHAMHEQMPGVVVTLRVELPGEGWLELKAETLYRRPGFGFGVRFIEMSESTRERLGNALDTLREQGGT